MESYAFTGPPSTAKISGSHGYRIDGDVAILNADLAIVSPEAQRAKWALQLWACEGPHQGGPLVGTKLAEAPVDLSDAAPGEFRSMQAETPVHMPAERHAQAMVLVLASGAEGTFEQVHDFANFTERQPFFVPHFDGAASYSVDGSEVVLRAERVLNPRATDNLSGSLALELRAVPETQGTTASEGVVVASVSIGRVAGQAAAQGVEERAAFSPPPPGQWRMTLALVEWTATGPATRDVRPFATPYRAEATIPVEVPVVQVEAEKVVSEPAATPAAASAVEEAAPSSLPEADSRPSIHTASVDDLARVNGLTRKLAMEIVKGRPFRSLDDLQRVRGIGEKSLRKLRSLLRM